MIRNTVAAIAIAAVTATALMGAAGSAEAGGKKRFHFKHHSPHFKVWHGHKRHFRGKCFWLKKKALYTDSHYWWKRYYKCRAFYY